jgi:peptidoglycan/xylan/chitin deacetylase (PgdA/CDA1 family)
MRLVSPLLKHVVYPVLHYSGWLDRITPLAGYAVVNYHGVVPSDYSKGEAFLDGNLVTPEVFRDQIRFLKTHYRFIHPKEVRASIEQGTPLPARSVLVTCDDGLLNTLTDMLPVLQSENVPCLFFVTGASCTDDPGMLWYEELYRLMRLKPLNEEELQLPINEDAQSSSSENSHAFWWNTVRRASRLDAATRADWMAKLRRQCGEKPTIPPEKRWRLLSVRELRQLADAGMTIGAHTITHPILSLCREEEARREIQQSKSDLERALGRPVWAFAYPFGNSATMGDRELRLARESGFACAFVNVEHWTDGALNPFALPRTHVTSSTTVSELAAHLSGFHNRLQRAVGAG